MDSKVYLDEKIQQAHYQDLLREAKRDGCWHNCPGIIGALAGKLPGSLGCCCSSSAPG